MFYFLNFTSPAGIDESQSIRDIRQLICYLVTFHSLDHKIYYDFSASITEHYISENRKVKFTRMEKLHLFIKFINVKCHFDKRIYLRSMHSVIFTTKIYNHWLQRTRALLCLTILNDA